MGRRGGDAEMQRGAQRGAERVERCAYMERAVPHSHVVDKNQEGYLRSK